LLEPLVYLPLRKKAEIASSPIVAEPGNDEYPLNGPFSLPSGVTVYCRYPPRVDMNGKNIILVVVAIAAFVGAIVVAVG
jgi:hypothetical protein